MEPIEEALGVTLDDVRPASLGQQRTFFARYRGDPVVVKWGLDRGLPAKIPYVASQLPELARRGIPVPAILAHGPIRTGGYAWLQQRLPGEPARTCSAGLLIELRTLLDRMRDAPSGPHRSDNFAWVVDAVRDDVAGWWANMAALGPTVRAIGERLRAWLDAVPPPAPRHDFVHLDFNLGNFLTAGDRIVGLIDLEHLGVGDRTVDVARLACAWFDQRQLDGLGELVHYGQSCNGEAGWRYAVAYDTIGRLGWRSQHTMAVDPRTVVNSTVGFLDAIGA